jgi:hypothetical protein
MGAVDFRRLVARWQENLEVWRLADKMSLGGDAMFQALFAFIY